MLNIAKIFLTSQPISLEVEKLHPEIEAVFSQANVLIFSHHYAQQKGFTDGKGLLEYIKTLAPNSHLVCTWGNKGVWFAATNNENVQHVKAEPITHVLDTLGAGDTFNSALVHHLIQKNSLAVAVTKASRLAAQKCQQMGLDRLLNIKGSKTPVANIKQLSNTKTMLIDTDSGKKSVILIKYENTIKAYKNNCPHQDMPLHEAYKIDVDLFEKTMKCSVHDAHFNIEDGLCVDGPCWNESLATVKIRVENNGDIFLV